MDYGDDRTTRELDLIRKALDNNHKLWHSLESKVEHVHEMQHEMKDDIAVLKLLVNKPEGITAADVKSMTDKMNKASDAADAITKDLGSV